MNAGLESRLPDATLKESFARYIPVSKFRTSKIPDCNCHFVASCRHSIETFSTLIYLLLLRSTYSTLRKPASIFTSSDCQNRQVYGSAKSSLAQNTIQTY